MIPPTAIAGLAALPASTPAIREMMRRKPANMPSSTDNRDALYNALDRYLTEQNLPSKTVGDYGVNPAGEMSVPDQGGAAALLQVLRNPNKFAAHGPGKPGSGDDYSININPNADRVLYAHEMGHIAAKQDGFGKAVAAIRDNNSLQNALIAASVLAPGVAAATADEDSIATQLGLAYALQSPIIMDEIMANKHALNLMEMANMRATLGQRGKMAGGLMTYLSLPLLAAAGGSMAGNAIESQLAG